LIRLLPSDFAVLCDLRSRRDDSQPNRVVVRIRDIDIAGTVHGDSGWEREGRGGAHAVRAAAHTRQTGKRADRPEGPISRSVWLSVSAT